jgi:hypothetical protein
LCSKSTASPVTRRKLAIVRSSMWEAVGAGAGGETFDRQAGVGLSAFTHRFPLTERPTRTDACPPHPWGRRSSGGSGRPGPHSWAAGVPDHPCCRCPSAFDPAVLHPAWLAVEARVPGMGVACIPIWRNDVRATSDRRRFGRRISERSGDGLPLKATTQRWYTAVSARFTNALIGNKFVARKPNPFLGTISWLSR